MIVAFVIGVFIGEGYTGGIERVSELTSVLVTIFVYIFSIRIYLVAYLRRDWLVISAMTAIIAANTFFSFTPFDGAISDVLFDCATFLTVLILFRYTDHVTPMSKKLNCFGRRAEDQKICETCSKPCMNIAPRQKYEDKP